MRAAFVSVLLLAVATLVFAAPAGATRCPAWNKMGAEEKSRTVEGMIERAVAGSGARSMQVDRAAVGRCMRDQSREIEYAFDSACSDSRTASMQALNRIFKDYIWSCVR